MKRLKHTLLSHWTIKRTVFLIFGGFILFNSITRQEWLGVSIGGYFVVMSLLNFGCAGGTCTTDYLDGIKVLNEANLDDVSFQEVKTK